MSATTSSTTANAVMTATVRSRSDMKLYFDLADEAVPDVPDA